DFGYRRRSRSAASLTPPIYLALLAHIARGATLQDRLEMLRASENRAPAVLRQAGANERQPQRAERANYMERGEAFFLCERRRRRRIESARCASSKPKQRTIS